MQNIFRFVFRYLRYSHSYSQFILGGFIRYDFITFETTSLNQTMFDVPSFCWKKLVLVAEICVVLYTFNSNQHVNKFQLWSCYFNDLHATSFVTSYSKHHQYHTLKEQNSTNISKTIQSNPIQNAKLPGAIRAQRAINVFVYSRPINAYQIKYHRSNKSRQWKLILK